MNSYHPTLKHIEALTQRMLEYARADAWLDVMALSLERQTVLEQLSTLPRDETAVIELEHLLYRIDQLNQSLATYAHDAKNGYQSALLKIHQGRKAHQCYTTDLTD